MPSSPSPSAAPSAAPVFLEDFEGAVQRLRGSLTDLLTDADVVSLSARDLGRRMALSTNLAWKISNLVRAADASRILPYLPGEAAWSSFFREAERVGVEAGRREAVRADLKALKGVIADHAGTRADLELMLSSSLSDRVPAAQVESSRKLSFRGNSATWGVQARAQLAVQIIQPHAADPTRIDIAQVSGLLGFRRLRPNVRWPLVRFQWDLDEESLAALNIEALDGRTRRPGELPWFGAVSSGPPPAVDARKVQHGTVFEIREGPAGSTAELDGLVGTVMRNYAPAFATQRDTSAALFATLSTPVEVALLDVYVHRSLAFSATPTARLTSRMELGAGEDAAPTQGSPLPLSEAVEELGSGPPVFTSPDVPRHSRLMETAFELLGADPGGFQGYRLAVRFPPIPTQLIMDCTLPTGPVGEEADRTE
jgi:hypothetical protein